MHQKNIFRARFTTVRKGKTQEAGTLHAFPHEGHAHMSQAFSLTVPSAFSTVLFCWGIQKHLVISQDPSVPRIIRMLFVLHK